MIRLQTGKGATMTGSVNRDGCKEGSVSDLKVKTILIWMRKRSGVVDAIIMHTVPSK